jgi:hypothetical protein
MLASLAGTALAAFVLVVSTRAIIVLQKEAELQTKDEFGRYKLDTEAKIAEANARQKEAELKLAQLRKLAGPRLINFDKLKEELDGKPKAPVTIWYVPEVPDGYLFATRLSVALRAAGWEVSGPQIIPGLTKEDVAKIWPNNAEQVFPTLREQPPAMNAGGQPNGVTVVGDGTTDIIGNAPMSPFKALLEALSKSTHFGMYGSSGSQFMPVPKGTLRVVVAAKTDPMFIDKTTPINRDK